MKRSVSLFFVWLFLGTFGYGASPHADTLPSIENIIEQIKHSSPSERKKTLSLLKQKLKGIKKTERRAMMRKLKHALQESVPRRRNRTSDILGSFSMGGNGDAKGHSSGHGGGQGGGNGSGGGGHGGR